MPLTVEEQAELEALEAKGPTQTTGGLTAEEEAELASLEAKGQPQVSQQQIQQVVSQFPPQNQQEIARIAQAPERTPEEEAVFQQLFGGQIPAGQEIVSEPATTAQLRSEAFAAGRQADVQLEATATEFLKPSKFISGTALRDTDTFTLLQTVSQAQLFRDSRKRNLAFKELKRRQIPDEFIRTFTELDKPTGFVAGLKEELPETIGGFIGAGVGALAGRGDPAAMKRGAIIGTAIGAGGVELLREPFERTFRPERRRGALDLTKDVAFTAATEALGEAGGRFVIDPLIGLVLRPGAKATIPGARRISGELAEAGRQVAREGGASPLLGTQLPIQTTTAGRALGAIGLSPNVSADLLPSQQTASKLVATIEGVTEEAFFGGGRLGKTREIAQKAASPRFVANKINQITEGLDVLPLDEIGVLAQDAIHGSKISGQSTRGASGAFRAVTRTLFDDIAKKVPETVDISSAQRIAKSVLDEAAVGGPRLKLPEKTAGILQNIVDTGSTKNIRDLIFARSDIGDLVRAAKLADEPKVEQVLAPVMKEITELMNDAARRAGPGVASDLKRALLFSSEGKKRFGSNLIRKLIVEKTPPEKVLRVIFGAPGDETLSPLTAVRNVKEVLTGTAGKNAGEIVNDTFAWDQIRFGWLTSKLKTAADVDEVIGGTSFQKILSNFGEPALKEMFSPKEIAGINDIVLHSRLLGKKSRKIASLIVKSAQVGTVGAGAATGKESIALLALGGPAVLGQFLTSPAGRKLLTTGIKTGALAGAEGQFIAGMLRTKREMLKKQARLEKFEEEQRRKLRLQLARPTTPALREQRGFGGRGF